MRQWPWGSTKIRGKSLNPKTPRLGRRLHPLEIALPRDAVFRTGKVADTIDYGVVVAQLRVLLAKERFGLVESLAERIADLILEDFKSPRVKVSVAKLGVLREAKQVGVTIERSRS